MPDRDVLLTYARRAPGWASMVRAIEDVAGVTRRRRLEAQLAGAYGEIRRLRAALAEATRPPAQFARMRMHERAVDRFARLRRATPRRLRAPAVGGRDRDLIR